MATKKQKSAGRKAGARARKCKGLKKAAFNKCLSSGKRAGGARRAKRRSRK